MEKYFEHIKVGALVIIAVCAIILVIQGFSKGDCQSVYVDGGSLDARVHGSVSVDNTVAVDVEEVLGDRVGAHKAYTSSGRQYWAIDVFDMSF